MARKRISLGFNGSFTTLFFTVFLLLFLTPNCFAEDLIGGSQYSFPENNVSQSAFALSALAESTSTNSFVGWMRYPAEEREWLYMSEATAYGRDVHFAGRTLARGATNGETWTATSTSPDGSTTITHGVVTFYDNYNGYYNCFVSENGYSDWVLCGGRDIYITWYYGRELSEEILPTGIWSMSFFNNDIEFYSGTFTLLPEINPEKITSFNQGAYDDHYDHACREHSCTNAQCSHV
jgi:hypothetical protein